MIPFISCANKDRLEFMRSRLNIICLLVLLGCGAMVLLSTAYMPLLLNKAMEVTDVMSADMSVSSFMEKFFPGDVKGSLGIFSSDIGIFYSLTVILLTYSLLPNDISTGRLILPLCAGYKKNTIFLSKQLVYSVLCAFPVFPAYLLYYYVGIGFLEINYSFQAVLLNALLWAVVIFSIVNLTIALSVLYRHKYSSLVTMALVIIVAPDLLSFFKFGAYFPTYLLTFLYRSEERMDMLVIPMITLALILALVNTVALKKQFSVEIDERR